MSMRRKWHRMTRATTAKWSIEGALAVVCLCSFRVCINLGDQRSWSSWSAAASAHFLSLSPFKGGVVTTRL